MDWNWFNILSLLVGGSGIASLIIAFITLPLTRKKSKAEIASLLTDIDDKRIKTLIALQDELYETIEKNKKLFVEQETERERKEKLRAELNRVHLDANMTRKDLQNARTEAIYLKADMATMNTALLKKQTESDQSFARIRELENTVTRLRNDLIRVEKVTDKLVMPEHKQKLPGTKPVD